MTPPITLAGTMPDETTNGLAPYASELMARPAELRLVVALVDVSKITQKTDTGESYPTLRIRHWELVPAGDDRKTVSDVLGRALSVRTGMVALPFEPGSEGPPPGRAAAEEE